ncbi:MAG: hypothetical protein ACXW0Z_04845, partial [Gemmatirosa sp.]
MPLPFTLRAIALAATLVLLPTVARAQAQSTHPALDGDARRAIVDSVARVLEARYVDTTLARRIGTRLRTQLASGAYEGIADAPTFATTLMRELQGVV